MAKSDNWATPPDLMQTLHNEFWFNLEVCASADLRALGFDHIPYMGLDNGRDALVEPWGTYGDVCYINPPYSMLEEFTARAYTTHTLKTVMLIPAYTDTKYWWNYIHGEADEVRFLKGRLRFWENGKPGKDTARFPSALVVFDRTKAPSKGESTRYYGWNWKVS